MYAGMIRSISTDMPSISIIILGQMLFMQYGVSLKYLRVFDSYDNIYRRKPSIMLESVHAAISVASLFCDVRNLNDITISAHHESDIRRPLIRIEWNHENSVSQLMNLSIHAVDI